MKVHIGCGKRKLPGWVNVDADSRVSPDEVAYAHKLPFKTGQVDAIMAIHLFEHLYLWEVKSALVEWNRVLKPGGRLILEMPDIMKAAANLLKGLNDQMSMWPLYGDPGNKNPYNSHRWGWHPESLRIVLTENGFTKIVQEPTQYHRVGRDNRDMRITSVKRGH